MSIPSRQTRLCRLGPKHQHGNKRIKVVKTWPEPKLVSDIHVFIRFANFYQFFIKGFSKIAAPLTSMLKTTTPAPLIDLASAYVVARGNANTKNLSKTKNIKKLPKSKKLDFAKADSSGADFLTSEAQTAFFRVQRAFTKASILYYSDPERHIKIETDASGYAISGVLSQIISHQQSSDYKSLENPESDPNFSKSENGQWYPVVFFPRKMKRLIKSFWLLFRPLSKNIDIQWHYQREQIEDRSVEFRYIPTKEQIADGRLLQEKNF